MASEVQIRIGNVAVGGGAPVAVQSMTLTKTHDVETTTAQIAALASAGCELVRVAVPKNEDAAALPLGYSPTWKASPLEVPRPFVKRHKSTATIAPSLRNTLGAWAA